ncbi:hypothetical protein [uncultured Kordia sp.]|uniref:hypothetical protein n=1 Tax=uncultured Kordia sp. TaxID=507699 RepID=UPI00261DAF71|nr:hypothetical protein [uncultured Kordia sp.]
MKKKNLIKKLQLKKSQVSNFNKGQVVGGSGILCTSYDISLLETCYRGCGLTDTCTQFNTCNNVTFLNCTVYNCHTNNCPPATNGCPTDGCPPGGSNEPSCPNFSC